MGRTAYTLGSTRELKIAKRRCLDTLGETFSKIALLLFLILPNFSSENDEILKKNWSALSYWKSFSTVKSSDKFCFSSCFRVSKKKFIKFFFKKWLFKKIRTPSKNSEKSRKKIFEQKEFSEFLKGSSVCRPPFRHSLGEIYDYLGHNSTQITLNLLLPSHLSISCPRVLFSFPIWKKEGRFENLAEIESSQQMFWGWNDWWRLQIGYRF